MMVLLMEMEEALRWFVREDPPDHRCVHVDL